MNSKEQRRSRDRTIIYRGAVITISPTTPEYRAKAQIFNNINFWVRASKAGVGSTGNSEVTNLTKHLHYLRSRINKAMTHPRHGWKVTREGGVTIQHPARF